MGDLREPSGVVLEESPSSSSSSSLSFPGREVWARAERATQEIIRKVQPSVVSEERRKDVIDYVQRLVKGKLGCEVFPFGSVPLKTYLPDGDIDLTAFCRFDLEESYANDLYTVLEREDHNPDAEFVVKDVQYIRAEVKLVKCLVQNIVVDISFNQIGGLCTLCFLEEVDRLIGKDNLFKRCIILIKAWCYYESRILGAHHGLISTYALETLVLHIFHLFHSSLSGPLAVLYKFLDYYSKFDWENYCVSLSGPVHVSSLPEIVAERPENGGVDLLLSHDFMRECVKKFCVPSRGTETNSRTFMQKHLNIVDPLKENNNLGRSVSKGNFFRIRSAFSYGARKLGQILSQPQENIAEEVQRFFTNTLDRHGQGHRPDVQDLLLLSRCDGFVTELLFPGAEPSQEESYTHEVESVNGECGVNSEDIRNLRITNVDKSENGKMENGDLNENSHDLDSKPIYSNTMLSSITRSCEKLNLLPDLSGDVDSQLDSLGYGRWWYEYDNFWATSPPPLFQQWDANAIQQSLQFRWDMVPHVNVNGVVPRLAFSPVIPPVVEMPKARGTGTYFPITNHHSYRDRRGRIQGLVKSPRTNGRAPTTRDRSPQARSPVHQGPGKPICSDFYESSPGGKVFKETNGFVHTSEKADEFAVLGHPPLDTQLPERVSNKAPDSSPPGSYNGESVLLVNNDRLPVRTYRLKDDEDFPPLSA